MLNLRSDYFLGKCRMSTFDGLDTLYPPFTKKPAASIGFMIKRTSKLSLES